MNTNLLACASHHRLWLETFPAKLTPTLKLKASAEISCNTFRFSYDVPDSDSHLLYKNWSTSLKLRETMLTKDSPTVHMGVIDNKHAVIMHCPSLITRSYNLQDKYTSHPDSTVGKIN